MTVIFVDSKQEMVQQGDMKKYTHVLLLYDRKSMKVYEVMGLIFSK